MRAITIALALAFSCESSRAADICESLEKEVDAAESTREAIKLQHQLIFCLKTTETVLKERQTSGAVRSNGELQVLIKLNKLKQVEAVQTRIKLVDEKNFEKGSLFSGLAYLRRPGPGGSSDAIGISGLQYMIPRKNAENESTFGYGPFLAVNLSDPKEEGEGNEALDYLGAGVVFSVCYPETVYQFNFGVGYMLDRRGFSDEMGQRKDRSGLFISVSFNPVASGMPLYRRLTGSDEL